MLRLNSSRSGEFDGYLHYVDFDITHGGVAIEGARVVFRLHGDRLMQFGAEGILPSMLERLNPTPAVDVETAQQIAFAYAGGFNPKTDTLVEPGRLLFLPRTFDEVAVGEGLAYPPRPGRSASPGAASSAPGSPTSTLQTARSWSSTTTTTTPPSRVASYETGPTTSSEQTMPMPYADVRNTSGTLQEYADSAGKFSYSSTARSNLNGDYVRISDSCGSISQQASSGSDIDFGTSGGTDCSTPGTGGAGNTHAARSAYYHLNRIKEKGRTWLPSNSWLQGQLTANMNINSTCNANWNGFAVNFYRSGGGCGNTGEIAAIFLHEYGHGLDSNDGRSPADLGTGEAYGDTIAFLQTHDSCIGPGFLGGNCSGYGDACTNCSGVRDVDYGQHSSGTPHTVSGFVRNTCPSSASYRGPCGKEGHCESLVISEALWDLANRRLPAQGYDSATAWYILDRLFYLTRPTTAGAYSCSNFNASGCGSSNWHQAFLAADDDDGNLSNGNPSRPGHLPGLLHPRDPLLQRHPDQLVELLRNPALVHPEPLLLRRQRQREPLLELGLRRQQVPHPP